ncbi:MAG: sugar ABC transporter permease, partial [Pelagibacteraceae bacterium]|nr:sugar ABC transporter permease [Pelagibacteraceae bacterium]
MINFLNKYSNQINGYLFVLPAFLIIGLFGIFPVFFGMFMSLHKWKVFKGRFLGFENYQKILGDISSFWVFVLGLLIMILSYWVWSEFKNKFHSKFYCFIISFLLLLLSLFLINMSWATMMEKGDEDFLNSLIYIFYYSFFAITLEVGFGLLIAFALYQKLKGKQ